MGTATDNYKILQNIIARVGIEGDLHSELAKAMSTLNGLQTYSELNPPTPNLQPPQATISPVATNTPLGQPTEQIPPQNASMGTPL